MRAGSAAMRALMPLLRFASRDAAGGGRFPDSPCCGSPAGQIDKVHTPACVTAKLMHLHWPRALLLASLYCRISNPPTLNAPLKANEKLPGGATAWARLHRAGRRGGFEDAAGADTSPLDSFCIKGRKQRPASVTDVRVLPTPAIARTARSGSNQDGSRPGE